MGGGHFKTPKELEERGKSVRGGSGPSEDQKKVCQALQEVADQIGSGTHLAHSELTHGLVQSAYAERPVAMAWARQQYPYTFPIIGGVKVEHLKSNAEVCCPSTGTAVLR
jgi:aryl-alcohol dehydrogenase-like predicted oxidoreductase